MDDARVRLALYRHFAVTGAAPTRAELAAACELGEPDVSAALERLDQGRAVVLDPRTRDVWMAMPFSAVPTDYRVHWGHVAGYANCAWDALGIAAAVGRDVTITTHDPLTREPLEVRVRDGQVVPDTLVVHFAVPAAHWWQDIGFT
ncbi:MAG: hypothetical protein HY275_10285 [Gemmatimonadetes bacterium]|nr:hypothetical protein [Gemmatimonadota bacterium]